MFFTVSVASGFGDYLDYHTTWEPVPIADLAPLVEALSRERGVVNGNRYVTARLLTPEEAESMVRRAAIRFTDDSPA